MKKKDGSTKHRRRTLPLALFGVLLGAGLAYALEQWRRALMPELQWKPAPEEVSIHEVSGDVTKDWPAGSADAPVAGPAATEAEDTGAGLWGDIPAGIALLQEGNGHTDGHPEHAGGRDWSISRA